MNLFSHFMLVDDDHINNLICHYLIQKHNSNAQVERFTNPEIALGAIEQNSSAGRERLQTVLFLDIDMPVMNAWEFLDKLNFLSKEDCELYSVYILTSSLDQNDQVQAQKSPFVKGYLNKPLSLDILKKIAV